MPSAYIGQYIGGNTLEIFRDIWTYASGQTGSSTQIVVTSIVSTGTLTTTINGSGFTFNSSGQVTGGIISDIHVDYDTGSGPSRIVDFQSTDVGGLNADVTTVFAALSDLAGGDTAAYLGVLGGYDITFDASTVTYAGGVEFISGNGDDEAYGGNGSDEFWGRGGDDYFDGGAGEDLAFFNTILSGDNISSDGTSWFVDAGSEGADTLDNVEVVLGGDGPDADNFLEVFFLVGAGAHATIDEAEAKASSGDTIVVQGEDADNAFGNLNNAGVSYVLRGGAGDDFASQMVEGHLDFFGYGGNDEVEIKVGDSADGGEGDDFLKLNTFYTPADLDIFVDAFGELQFEADGVLLDIANFEGFEVFANNTDKDFLLDLRGYTKGFMPSSFTIPQSSFNFYTSGEVTLYVDADTVGVASIRRVNELHLDFAGSNESAYLSYFDLRHGTKLDLSTFGNSFESVDAIGGSAADYFYLDHSSMNVVANLAGNAGEDVFYLNKLGGTINGGADNDSLNGNIGIDTAIFSGSRYDYVIDFEAGVISGPDGTDTFTDIEFFQFDDGTLDLTTGVFSGPSPTSGVTIKGSSGADVIDTSQSAFGQPNATEFGDTIYGLGGNDVINGGSGIDTAVYAGNLANYTIDYAAGTVTDNVGDEGTDTLTDVELLQFADGTVSWSSFAPNVPSGLDYFGGDGADLLIQNAGGHGFVLADGGSGPRADLGGSGLGWDLVAAGDFEGGPKAEMVFHAASGNVILMREDPLAGSPGHSDFELISLGGAGLGWSVLGAGEFDGSGFTQVLVQNGGGHTFLIGEGGRVDLGGSGLGWTPVAFADVDGSGLDDLVFESASGANFAYLDGTSSRVNLTSPPEGWTVVGVADFDGSGTESLLAESEGRLYLADAGGRAYVGGSATIPWTVAAIGDYDGDGASDITVQNQHGYLFNLSDNGAVRTEVGGGGLNWQIIAVADANNDGADDLLIMNANNHMFLLNGADPTDRDDIGVVHNNAQLAAIGDFNGGGDDFIMQRDSGGYYVLTDSGASRVQLGGDGLGWSLLDVADFDSDGTDDLLFENASGHMFLISEAGSTRTDFHPASSQGWDYLSADLIGDTDELNLLV